MIRKPNVLSPDVDSASELLVRTRRYESAGGFVRDVERYLADEPVQACPLSAG